MILPVIYSISFSPLLEINQNQIHNLKSPIMLNNIFIIIYLLIIFSVHLVSANRQHDVTDLRSLPPPTTKKWLNSDDEESLVMLVTDSTETE